MKTQSITTITENDKHITTTDGQTVWINNELGLIGRFGPRGVDIHLNGVCHGPHCVTKKVNKTMWDHFVTEMLNLHKVTIPNTAIPSWLLKNQ